MKDRNGRKVIYVLDVPLCFVEYCIKHSETKAQADELRKMARQLKAKRSA